MEPVREPALVLAAIRDVMSTFPDMRVGQAIVNAVHNADLFYMEDRVLADALAAYNGEPA